MPLANSMNPAMEELRRAYQNALEYGIDMGQLEYLLSLTPVERLRNPKQFWQV
jgi:hypothetical protein